MGCCGEKRRAWQKNIRKQSSKNNPPEEIQGGISERPPQVFESLENNSLILKGAVTGKTYFFKGKGHRLTIDFMDAYGMQAEPFIKKVAK
ncbi:hypothetical protein [Arenibacter amylolyticus]|uniref:hypothetical protein n=1 Tax=Arenibacter amylolyticus TaxID=1406873 RepID=UPI000A38C9A7|nr:hypothetical protein [Arenibacter amylolyticus]